MTEDQKKLLAEKIKIVEDGYKKLQEEQGIVVEYDISFPQYNPKMLPAKISLASIIMEEEKGIIIRRYNFKKEAVKPDATVQDSVPELVPPTPETPAQEEAK